MKFFIAASFEIDAMATITEGETQQICAEMRTAGAILEREVRVTLSTENGTGTYITLV